MTPGAGAGRVRPAEARPAPVEIRVEVTPPWPFRLPGGSADGLTRRRGAALQRLLRVNGEPVLVGVVQPAADRVLFAARAATGAAAREGIARMRFATGVDDDLRPFYERFRDDPVIGKAVRTHPTLRVRRKPFPWEALVAAVTEQLIEFERAVAIQRRIIRRLGYRCPATGMRDAADPAAVAGEAPARLVSLDLAPKRAIALRRCAAAAARGRLEHARLLAIPEIGPWTVEMFALHGEGRMDMVPAGDLGYLKLVGRLVTGNPRARADEAEVRGFFERYGAWKGLAGEYLRLTDGADLSPDRIRPRRAPRPAGTRWSAAPARPRAA